MVDRIAAHFDGAKIRKWTHVIVILFLILATVHALTEFSYTSRERVTWQFIGNVIFLNTIHVAFTYVMLLTIPELRNWYREAKRKDSYLLIKWIAFFVFIFVLHWFLFSFSEWTRRICMVALFAYAIHHPLRQHLGMSLLFNRRAGFAVFEKEERLLIHFLVLACTLQAVLRIGFKEFLDSHFYFINSLFLVFCVLPIFGLVALLLYRHREKLWEKSVFLLRLLFYPLSFFTFFGTVGLNSAHGMEYLEVFSSVKKRSRAKNEDSQFYVRAVFAFLIFLTILIMALVSAKSGILGIYLEGHSPRSFWYEVSWVGLTSFSYLHYYIDGQVFRMRNKESRENILPLIAYQS